MLTTMLTFPWPCSCLERSVVMFIIQVATNDPLRVIRRFEEKPGHLLAITCPEGEKRYQLVYSMETDLHSV